VEAAREAAENNPTVYHGGVLGQPSERVEALEHFRLVHAGGPVASSPFDRLLGQQPVNGYDEWVKTFERVDGATVEGTGPANTEVRGSVEMEIRSTGQTFIYTQYAETDADGNFEMTVPYSTTGYDEYGPENGHTNVDVRANGSYQFVAPEAPAVGTADVTEAQVVGDDDTPVTVELQTPEIRPSDGSGGGGSTDGDGGSGSGGDTQSNRGVRIAE
jgi:dolichyl-diphosphooligosaccharide--protein glycosyltransferase